VHVKNVNYSASFRSLQSDSIISDKIIIVHDLK
jgi:hypothetical protein